MLASDDRDPEAAFPGRDLQTSLTSEVEWLEWMLPLLAGLLGQVALWMLLLSSSRLMKQSISHSKIDLADVAEAADVLSGGSGTGTSDRVTGSVLYGSECGTLSAEVGLRGKKGTTLVVIAFRKK